MHLGPRQSGYERANLVYLSQQVLPVLRTYQIVEDRAGHDPEPACLERGPDPRHVERHVAIRTKLQAAEARLRSLVQYALPVRQVRVGHVVHPPAAGCASYGDGQGHVSALPAALPADRGLERVDGRLNARLGGHGEVFHLEADPTVVTDHAHDGEEFLPPLKVVT